MKLAVFCESPADEAGLWELAQAILAPALVRGEMPPLRSRGWPSVVDNLPTVIRHLHYRTDADALVVIADGDNSEIHHPDHQQGTPQPGNCRYCQLRTKADATLRTLSSVEGRAPIKVGVAVATPSVEAWYRFATDRNYTEDAWRVARRNQPDAASHIRELKRHVYGTERPSLALETLRAVEACRAAARKLELLQSAFPNGFGLLAAEMRSWLPG